MIILVQPLATCERKRVELVSIEKYRTSNRCNFEVLKLFCKAADIMKNAVTTVAFEDEESQNL